MGTRVRYFLAWFGMMILAIGNGGLRDSFYRPHVGDLAAHQISTAVLIVLFAVYFRLLASIWPIRSAGQAWAIGLMWMAMTFAFEFVLGHYILGHPWSRVLQEYDILAGKVWGLIPLWTLVGPYVFYRLGRCRSSEEGSRRR